MGRLLTFSDGGCLLCEGRVLSRDASCCCSMVQAENAKERVWFPDAFAVGRPEHDVFEVVDVHGAQLRACLLVCAR